MKKGSSGLMRVEIKDAFNGKAQLYIDGKKVNGVIGYSIEQNSQDKRVPVLNLQVLCEFDMDSGAIPKLPEPWSWFYVPKVENFVADIREIGKKSEHRDSNDEPHA